VVSFYFEHIHYNLVARLLSDRFGIQVRGGCACAGTYGHFQLNVDYERSHIITEKINTGDLSDKPGWVRISLHPTTTNEEAYKIIGALEQIRKHHKTWIKDYIYLARQNEYVHKSAPANNTDGIKDWFTVPDTGNEKHPASDIE